MQQPNLFESEPKTVDAERLVLYALGEFQARKKELAGRELALDRLRGAFRRAAEQFETEELTDEVLANELEKLGAKVTRRPSFVAKHPFRVIIGEDLANHAAAFYQQAISEKAKAKI
jgi:hypothetical protein